MQCNPPGYGSFPAGRADFLFNAFEIYYDITNRYIATVSVAGEDLDLILDTGE